MPSIKYTINVVMDDEAEHRVTADQRDIAAWEGQPFGTSSIELKSKWLLWQRYAAWHAMRRQGLIPKSWSWEVFNEGKCVQAILDESGAGEDVDPGQPDQSTDNSSS